MSEHNRTEGMTSGIAAGSTVASCVLHEAEAWTNAQCELASGLGTIWTGWLKRRREAVDAAARSLEQAFACRNLADLAQIQQQWLADATRRMTTDITALACDTAALNWWAAAADRAGRHNDAPSTHTAPVRAKSSADVPAQRAAAE